MAYDGDRSYIAIGDAAGFSVVGTAAANTTTFRFRVPRTIVIDEASVVALTGGTAAGPSFILAKSLAGTGTAAGFATHAFGTNADGASAALTVTATTFDAEDHLLLQTVAGTVASTPKANVMVGFHFGIS